MRLFSALWPPEPAVQDLEQAVSGVEFPEKLRLIPAQRWHLTLCFYGNDADPDERATHLRKRLTGLPAPRLRLARSGAFAGVLWVGVDPESDADRTTLHKIAAAAGAERRFHPHVTIARWHGGRLDRSAKQQLASYRGPVWTATEVSLMHSALGRGGPTYTTVHRVPLAAW